MDTGSANKSRFRIKPVILVILAALILCFAVAIYRYEYNIFFERETVSLAGYQKDVAHNAVRRVDFSGSMESMINMEYFIQENVVLSSLLQLTAESKDELVEVSETTEFETDFYYIDKKLQLVRQLANNPLTLSEDQLSQLVREKTLAADQRCYTACEAEDGYYVLGIDADYSALNDIDYDMSKVVPYVIWDNVTGEIQDYGGEQFSEEMKALAPSDLSQEILTAVDGITLSRVKVGNQAYLAAYSAQDIAGTDATVSVFTEDGQSHRKALAGALIFALIAALFTVCAYVLITRLQEKRFTADDGLRTGRVLFHHLHHRSYRDKMKSSLSILTAFFLLVSYFLFLLLNMMAVNTDITTAFRNLSLMEESNSKNEEVIYNSMTQSCKVYANEIAWNLTYTYEIDMDEWLVEKAEILNFDEITLYDGNGVIVNSSSYYKGYKLPEDETDNTYFLWQILRNGKEAIVNYDKEAGKIYIACRRLDDTGILLLVSSNNTITPLLESVEFADVLATQKYADADIFYSNRSDSKNLYLLESGSAVAKSMTNILPDTGDDEFTIGIRELDNQHYLFFNMGSSDRIIAYAYPLAELVTQSLVHLALAAAVFLLIAVLLFYKLVGKASSEASETSSENTDAVSRVDSVSCTYEQFSAEQHRLFYFSASVMTLFSVLLLLVGKSFSGGTSLSQLFAYMEKGANLISIFYSIMLVILFAGLIILISSLNTLICKPMTSKGATICTLLSNIVKLILVVVCLVSILEQFGVNAVAILSSLGLVGLALSMGSKDVISDMLAGLFMAFEGQFQIGDFVEINGFSGEITSLGIRITKLHYKNKEYILNNSSMKNATNYSRGAPCVGFTVVLPFDTDLDFVSRLTKEYRERFVRVTENKLTGNFWLYGVTECKSYGMEVLFLAIISEPKFSNRCSAKCRMEMIKLLREKGIQPAEAFIRAE